MEAAWLSAGRQRRGCTWVAIAQLARHPSPSLVKHKQRSHCQQQNCSRVGGQ